MASSFTTVVDNAKKLEAALRFQKETSVLVGIPQKKTTRLGDPVTNAELLYIHSKGSPVNNIPARPVIEPAIADDHERLGKMMVQAFRLALDGQTDKAIDQLKLTGIRAQNVCRAWFLNPKNHWPPNSPRTAARKTKKGSTPPRPLIDTGELRKSITYVIEKKGQRQDAVD